MKAFHTHTHKIADRNGGKCCPKKQSMKLNSLAWKPSCLICLGCCRPWNLLGMLPFSDFLSYKTDFLLPTCRFVFFFMLHQATLHPQVLAVFFLKESCDHHQHNSGTIQPAEHLISQLSWAAWQDKDNPKFLLRRELGRGEGRFC